MKRIEYISRFAKSLTPADIADIQRAAQAYNASHDVTGFLITVGTVFFQLIEGPDAAIDELFSHRIRKDSRHTGVVCLKIEQHITEREFPEWSMKVFNLNAESAMLPRAFQRMVESLGNSYEILAAYTQPSVSSALSAGLDPRAIAPERTERVILVSDIVDSSRLASGLSPEQLVAVINQYAQLVTATIMAKGGVVNKFTGDGVLALFEVNAVDAALAAGQRILQQLARVRQNAGEGSPCSSLRAGVGIACGPVSARNRKRNTP